MAIQTAGRGGAVRAALSGGRFVGSAGAAVRSSTNKSRLAAMLCRGWEDLCYRGPHSSLVCKGLTYSP